MLEYADVCAVSNEHIGRTGTIIHRIRTGEAESIRTAPRNVAMYVGREVDQEIEDMLERGLIEPSDSPWAASVKLVRTKDGKQRFR